jgi:hypothetical protein
MLKPNARVRAIGVGISVHMFTIPSVDLILATKARKLRLRLKWSDTNQTSNNSRVRFVPGPPPAGAVDYGLLTIRTGGTQSAPAVTDKNTQSGPISSATITFNLNATLPDNPLQKVFDLRVSGYTSIFRKVMLHELGHTMGLLDVKTDKTKTCFGQTQGHSVMNAICGQNDRSNNMPMNVQDCDNQQVNSETLYPAGPCYNCDIYAECVQDPQGPYGDPYCYAGCEYEDDCAGDPCCEDPECCGDPCCLDPECCGDPCCGDPECCGDPCCGDPNCGQDCYQVCSQVCYTDCTAWDDYGNCYWYEEVCDPPDCEIQCN